MYNEKSTSIEINLFNNSWPLFSHTIKWQIIAESANNFPQSCSKICIVWAHRETRNEFLLGDNLFLSYSHFRAVNGWTLVFFLSGFPRISLCLLASSYLRLDAAHTTMTIKKKAAPTNSLFRLFFERTRARASFPEHKHAWINNKRGCSN